MCGFYPDLHITYFLSLYGEHHECSSHPELQHISEFHQIRETKRLAKYTLMQYNFTLDAIETELEGESCEMSTEHF